MEDQGNVQQELKYRSAVSLLSHQMGKVHTVAISSVLHEEGARWYNDWTIEKQK